MTAEPLPASVRIWGRVRETNGLVMRLVGLAPFARIGDRVTVEVATGRPIAGEIVAIGDGEVTALLTTGADGLAARSRAYLESAAPIKPSDAWLGEVLDCNGCRADGTRPPEGSRVALLRAAPPPAAERRGLGPRLATGLAATDTFLPLCQGQRIGVFAGSGVGKSSLLGALARGVTADVVVLGLIGERGREVGEFVRTTLGPAQMSRTVVISSTAEEPALAKRRAAHLTLALAEHFRSDGRHVLCLLDSLTRLAEAHREIALAAGEVPALRAFPPSTAPHLAQLCERAGPGTQTEGDITAVFTVLAAGSEMEEPVADMVRGILDGHIVLDRAIAERGRFPAIDIRTSVSRSAPAAWTETEAALVRRAKALIGAYEDAAALIRTGLYEQGADPFLDEAIARYPHLDRFIGNQDSGRAPEEAFAMLATLLEKPVAGLVARGSEKI
ncbi:MAG: FliI/YscN family ATPase [Paracoccaceae bacterium]